MDWTFYEHEIVGEQVVYPLLQRLRFSVDERVRVTDLVRNHIIHYQSSWTDAAVRRWIRRVGKHRLDDLYALYEADVRSKDLDAVPDFSENMELRARAAADPSKNEAGLLLSRAAELLPQLPERPEKKRPNHRASP